MSIQFLVEKYVNPFEGVEVYAEELYNTLEVQSLKLEYECILKKLEFIIENYDEGEII